MTEIVDVKELMQYNAEVRHRYFDTLAQLPWEELVRDRGASWHSLRNIFIHTLNAADFWLTMLEGSKKHAGKKFDDYRSLEDIQQHILRTEKRLDDYLARLSPSELGRLVTIEEDGSTVQAKVEDILVHVFEEEVHHRAEIIAPLWQMDIQPPAMGWKDL